MTVYPKLLLRYPFEILEMGGETVAVAVEEGAERFHGVIKLKNESAAFIFRHLQQGVNLPDMIYLCLKEYSDSTVEEVGPMVIGFLEELRKEGVLVAEPPKEAMP